MAQWTGDPSTLTYEDEPKAAPQKIEKTKFPVSLPTMADSYNEQLAGAPIRGVPQRAPGGIDKFLAGAGGLWDQAAYSLKKSFGNQLTPAEQQRLTGAHEVQQTVPGMAGAVTTGALATAPLYASIPALAATTPGQVGMAGLLGATQGALTTPENPLGGALLSGAGSGAGTAVSKALSPLASNVAARFQPDELEAAKKAFGVKADPSAMKEFAKKAAGALAGGYLGYEVGPEDNKQLFALGGAAGGAGGESYLEPLLRRAMPLAVGDYATEVGKGLLPAALATYGSRKSVQK